MASETQRARSYCTSAICTLLGMRDEVKLLRACKFLRGRSQGEGIHITEAQELACVLAGLTPDALHKVLETARTIEM